MSNNKIPISEINKHLSNMNLHLYSDYRNKGRKTTVVCNYCGLIRDVFTATIKRENCACQYCGKLAESRKGVTRKKTKSERISLFAVHNPNFKNIDFDYENGFTAICKTCGKLNNYKDYIYATRNSIKCKHCCRSVSSNELYVRKVFDNQNINYECQKKFKELGNKRFDFYLPDYNILIEIQGEQHYKPVKFPGSKDSDVIKDFERTLESDKMKIIFANENNIKLLIWDARNSRNSNKFYNTVWNFVESLI